VSKAPSFEASFDAEGIERCCRRRGDGNGEGYTLPSQLGYLGERR